MGTSQRVSRVSHRVGLVLASIALVIGLAVTVADAVHLQLWTVTLDELPVVIGGVVLGLLGLGLACLLVYGLVRAIGWVIGGFMAS